MLERDGEPARVAPRPRRVVSGAGWLACGALPAAVHREGYQTPVRDILENTSGRQLSRLPLHRLLRRLARLPQEGATRAQSLLVMLIETSIPKPRIVNLDLVGP